MLSLPRWRYLARRERQEPPLLLDPQREARGIVWAVSGGLMFWALLGYVIWRVV